MVTRNIKANTATQVNANLIGVLVHPDTNITVTVDDIVVDYTYTKFVIANGVPKRSSPGEYVDAISGDNNVYWRTGDKRTVDGTIYYSWRAWPRGSVVWSKSYIVEPDMYLYDIDFRGNENPVINGEADIVKSTFLNIDGNIHTDIPFIKIGESALYNSNFSSTYLFNGEFLCNTEGYAVGYVVSGPAVITDPNVTFTKGNVEEGYQTWTNENYVSEGFGTLYTPTDSPAVGDKALFTLFEVKYEYNPQTIKAINTTETPGVTDPVNCKLSYSVDGSTWTDWPENITDDNNVISNIPRYMYLKFSQDVVITEE